MYPRNAASPPRISIGAVVQISDGAVQTAGVSVAVRTEGGAETAGSGIVSYGTLSGIVYYTPTQAETNYTAFVLVAYKTGCIPIEKSVVTTASETAGYAGLDWAKVGNPTSVVGLSSTTISTSQAVGSVSGAVGSVTARVTANTDQWGGVAVTGMPLPTTSYTAPPTVGLIADAVWDEAYAGHTTAGTFGKLMDTLRKSNTVIEGTILASPIPTQTVFRISGADYPTGALEHAVLWMASGVSQEQNSPILTTVNNGDGTLTITLEEALVTAPSAGDTVLIDPTSHVHAIADIQAGLATVANQATAQADINDIQSRLPAALVAGRMDASVGAMQADTVTAAALATDAVTEIQAGLSTLTDVQVKAQIIEALSVDILAEISTIPGASSTLTDRIGLLFTLARNKLTQTSSTQTVFADNGSTTIGTASVSDNGTTFTRNKLS